MGREYPGCRPPCQVTGRQTGAPVRLRGYNAGPCPPGLTAMTGMTATPERAPDAAIAPATTPAPSLVPLPGAAPRATPGGARGQLHINTPGCPLTEDHSARMADVLAEHEGLELTDNPEEADVVLVNTCSIREKAQEKVFSQLGRWKALKDGGRDVIIGVGGCVASQEGEAI